MNVGSWLLWGFVATVVLTAILAGSQGLGLTRMNIPYLLGTLFTPNRDRAKWAGILVHFVNGWLFSLIYVAAFHAWGQATWWLGAITGVVHAGFVLAAGLFCRACTRGWPASNTGRPSSANWSRRASWPCTTGFGRRSR
jgi:hypothetical protein